MMWTVNYAESARQDLRDIREYISDTLSAPVAAMKQVTRIMDATDSLDHMPLRCRLCDKEPWQSKGLRILPVDNFLVLYLPDESSSTVTVMRIMYGRRDIYEQLDTTE